VIRTRWRNGSDTHDFLKIEVVVSAARPREAPKEPVGLMYAVAIVIESDLLHTPDRHGEIAGRNTKPEYEVHFERESAATESPYTGQSVPNGLDEIADSKGLPN